MFLVQPVVFVITGKGHEEQGGDFDKVPDRVIEVDPDLAGQERQGQKQELTRREHREHGQAQKHGDMLPGVMPELDRSHREKNGEYKEPAYRDGNICHGKQMPELRGFFILVRYKLTYLINYVNNFQRVTAATRHPACRIYNNTLKFI
jgi:hypothetical protein